MTNPFITSTTVWGQYIQYTSIIAARVLVAAYVAGFMVGNSIHNLNNSLSFNLTNRKS